MNKWKLNFKKAENQMNSLLRTPINKKWHAGVV